MDEQRPGKVVLEVRLLAEDLIPDSRLTSSSADAFGHRGIAARVADVVTQGEVPLNIALFGAWGSGKSSFFQMLKDAVAVVAADVKVVRYDAWKFGGESLKRNFLSNAATELGLGPDDKDGHKYHRGLYESSRTVEFDIVGMVKKHGKPFAFLIAGTAAVLTIAVVGAALLMSHFHNVGFDNEFSRLAPDIYKYVGSGLLALGALINVLATANVEQTSPSEDERFAELFGALLKDATGKAEPEDRPRLVFFIDELDRCSPQDVVSTLTSLRTFLDQPGCVFIVAADREVLEEALTGVDQATPLRESEPYYSSASAFLDKIFQHQIALPPLRTGRLTRFARELVEDRGGLWLDIRSAEPNGRRLDRVMHALIPHHVRSPRRVKVLLNNFATNVRVIESCGIPWQIRAAEIAKLTVIQTEFPRLASDLLLEPRLPALLLDPPTEPSKRQAELIARHRLLDEEPGPAATNEGEKANAGEDKVGPDLTEDPDRLIVAGAEDSKRVQANRLAALREQQRADLLRYLKSRSAAGVPDPGRDLLYLEDAGQVVDLGDPELSQLLEDWAAEDPDRVMSALTKRPAEQRIAAARMLGLMSERDVGFERVNTITAMAQALVGISPEDLAGRIGDLIANTSAYLADESATEAQLAGLFTLAVCAGESGDGLRGRILDDPRLLTDSRCLAELPPILPHLTEQDADRVGGAICARYTESPGILNTILTDASSDVAKGVLRAGTGELVKAIKAIDAPAAPTADDEDAAPNPAADATAALLDALIPRLSSLAAEGDEVLRALVAEGPDTSFSEIDGRLDEIAEALGAGDRLNRLCLTGVSVGDAAVWASWASHLDPAARMGNEITGAASQVIGTFLDDVATNVEYTFDTLPKVLSCGTLEALPVNTIANTVAALATLDFWILDDAMEAWEQAHRIIEMLSSAVPDQADALAEAVAVDIGRAATTAWDASTPRRVSRAGFIARDPGLMSAAEVLENVGAGPEQDADVALARVTEQMKVAGQLADRGLAVPDIDPVSVRTVARAASANGAEAVAAWLRTDPTPDQVLLVIAAASYQTDIVTGVRDWAGRLAVGQAGSMLVAAVDDASIQARWFEPLGGITADRNLVLKVLTGRFKTTSAHADRQRIAEAVYGLQPAGHAEGKIVADALIWLLHQDSKVTSDEAAVMASVLPAIGSYSRKTQVTAAVIAADKAGNLTRQSRKRFEDADLIAAKKKNVVQRVLGR